MLKAKIVRGALLKLTGLTADSSIIDKLKEFFQPFGEVAYVQFKEGSNDVSISLRLLAGWISKGGVICSFYLSERHQLYGWQFLCNLQCIVSV